MKLQGLQANFLLYALDEYCKTNSRGKVTFAHGYAIDFAQNLRDRLMAIHDHGDEDCQAK